MSWQQRSMTGWGRNLQAQGLAARPERMAELARLMAQPGQGSLIAHGAGRSYGDTALSAGGRMLLTTRLDRVLGFDEESGLLQAEPGVDFRRLLKIFLPRGFLAPVTPGTGFATLGGALANDVHGKNHEAAGSFGEHVTSFELLLPDGSRREVTREGDAALFAATMGGIGLTGIITRITMRMMRVPGPNVAVRMQRAPDLDAFLALLRDARQATYSVGWIDGTARGRSLGRGILETAEPVSGGTARPPKPAPGVPVDFPAIALNPLSVAAFNEIYFRRVPAAGQQRVMHYGAFLYPLDAIANWNRIYGRRGFHQFQCVLPFAGAEAALRALLERIAQSRAASFLAVLKRMGAGSGGYLSFPMPGYTLALDFPHTGKVAGLYHDLVAITRQAGGRIYLGKDSLLTAAELDGMYPDLPLLRDVLISVDPHGRMGSDMSRRLGLSA